MHCGQYPAASAGLVLRVGEPRRRPTRPKRFSSQRPPSEEDFAETLLHAVGKNAEWRARSVKVADLQDRLRRQVSHGAWQTYLDLEEADVARWHSALLLVARWALESQRARRRR